MVLRVASRIMSNAGPAPTAKLEGHGAGVFAVCVIGDLIATGSEDSLIKLWTARG